MMTDNEIWERFFEGLKKAASAAREMSKEFIGGTAKLKFAHDEFVKLAEQFDSMRFNGMKMKLARALSKQANEVIIEQKIEQRKAEQVANGETTQ
jgi:hypothetical protein